MTIKQAYIYGFAEALAERGIAPSELQAAMMKSSKEGRGNPVASVLAGMLKARFLVPMTAGSLLGAYGGWLFGGKDDITDADIEAEKDKLMLAEYAAQIDKLRRQQHRELGEIPTI